MCEGEKGFLFGVRRYWATQIYIFKGREGHPPFWCQKGAKLQNIYIKERIIQFMVSEGTKLRANCKKIVENKFVRNKICINLYFL